MIWPTRIAVLLILAATSCGAEAPIGPTEDATLTDTLDDPLADVGDAASATDADMDALETPTDIAPCTDGDCWDTSIGGAPCSLATHDEDFSSGSYNVHRYASTAWDGAPTRIAITANAGSWEPVLVVTDASGLTLFDGETALDAAGIAVEAVSATELTITTESPLGLIIHVTDRSTLESGFAERISTDATYTLLFESDCGTRVRCTVNGNNVREPACGWLHYVGRRVVPVLSGTRAERIDKAGVVAWWSLKEGVMFLPNPIVYSNCNLPTGDERIGPLESCVDGRAWQVGLSGVQVAYHDDALVEAVTQRLHRGRTIEQVLRDTAREALLSPADVDAVVASTGTLRRSWLLRNSAVGFVIEEPVVRAECIDDSRAWCYGTGWDTTELYAPNRTAALGAIEDVKALLDQVAP